MNTRPAIESSNHPVALSACFNQDATCFAVGLNTGFCIFNSEPCQLRVTRDFKAGIAHVAMLGKANYIAIIGGGTHPKFPPNRITIWDDAKQRPVITIPVLSTIRSVRLSRSFIVIALHNSIHVYNFKSTPDVWAVFETADNPLGLCCLGEKRLAFPGRTRGQVQLVELGTKNLSIIPAHSGALVAIAVSRDEKTMATASETGTLVRVFATSNCARIAELRRGVDHATVFDVKISPGGMMVAVTSDKSTLHVFDVSHPSKPSISSATNSNRRLNSTGSMRGGSPAAEESQKWGLLGKIPLLPRVFSDVYSFASAHFEIGDEALYGATSPLNSPEGGFRAPKGVIGWTSDESIIVVGAGRDGRWEKFVIVEGDDGKRVCVREGWKRYLGAG
ncbi:WD40-repeat-containing domain protein [Calycina marina]|uniref:WD40-repeat-containing domain protein n=1 Tax=Calycina marina TaxID=1763456 RepID=A0A9P8CF01_9HELO|nr:WD40-repeat-containing domain protein [Calycina marina]